MQSEYAAPLDDPAGAIRHYDLGDWWQTAFTAGERALMAARYPPLTDDRRPGADETPQAFLVALAARFSRPGEEVIADRILNKAEEMHGTIVDLHYLFHARISLLQRCGSKNARSATQDEQEQLARRQIGISARVADELRNLRASARSELPEIVSFAEFAEEFRELAAPLRTVPPLPQHLGFETLIAIEIGRHQIAEALTLIDQAQQQGWALSRNLVERIPRLRARLKHASPGTSEQDGTPNQA